MNETQSRGYIFEPHVLATDLDGTLIPLDDSHDAALQILSNELSRTNIALTYVTGRDFGLTQQALQQYQLPTPEWIICDVGSSMFKRNSENSFVAVEEYHHHLGEVCQELPVETLREHLQDWPGLRLQEEEKQGEFKLSFYSAAEDLNRLERELIDWLQNHSAPWSIIASVDPFTNDGLIDFLPHHVSKAYALEWWRNHELWEQEQIVFAGDSGNDVAALTAGYLTIVVGNAAENVRERVQSEHQKQGWNDRLYLADNHSTSGVLEGCRHYGMF